MARGSNLQHQSLLSNTVRCLDEPIACMSLRHLRLRPARTRGCDDPVTRLIEVPLLMCNPGTHSTGHGQPAHLPRARGMRLGNAVTCNGDIARYYQNFQPGQQRLLCVDKSKWAQSWSDCRKCQKHSGTSDNLTSVATSVQVSTGLESIVLCYWCTTIGEDH